MGCLKAIGWITLYAVGIAIGFVASVFVMGFFDTIFWDETPNWVHFVVAFLGGFVAVGMWMQYSQKESDERKIRAAQVKWAEEQLAKKPEDSEDP